MRTPCRISLFVQGAQVSRQASPSLSISFIIHSYRNWWQPPEFKFSWNRLNSFFGLDCARPKTVPMRPTHMGTRRALILAWALFPVHANSSPYFFPDMPYPRLIRWVQAYPFSRLLWRGVVWAGTSGCWPSGAHGQSGSYASSDGGSAPRWKRGYDPNSGPPFHTLARLDEEMRQNGSLLPSWIIFLLSGAPYPLPQTGIAVYCI